MLTSLWLLFAGSFLKAVGTLLPDYSGMPSEINEAVAFLINGFNIFSFVFPIDTMAQVVLLGLTIELAIWGYKWGNWLYNKIRGSG